MSTHDVPGANPSNGDTLAMGCWAEHDDGSLVFVESTEQGRVIFSMFDTRSDPITEYRHALTEAEFKKRFTWNPDDDDGVTWTWHDKTPFAWDRVIKAGARPGTRAPSADDTISAAEKVAASLDARVTGRTGADFSHLAETVGVIGNNIIKGIQDAITRLGR